MTVNNKILNCMVYGKALKRKVRVNPRTTIENHLDWRFCFSSSPHRGTVDYVFSWWLDEMRESKNVC